MATAVDGERSVNVQTIVPPWLYDWLKERADSEGIGMSTFIRMKLIELRRIEIERTAA